MGEHKVRPAGHEIEFIVVRRGNKHNRHIFGDLVPHLLFRKTLITGDFVRLIKGGKEVHKEEIGAGTRFESGPGIGVSFKRIGGMEPGRGRRHQIGIVSQQYELHHEHQAVKNTIGRRKYAAREHTLQWN